MTVEDLFKGCRVESTLKVMSAYNGRVLCYGFNPEKHKEIGEWRRPPMTPEKQETAINWLKEEIRSLRLAPEINGCGPENWADLLEIMETCLEAVKNHFPDLTKMVPLSPEQLREMDGQPVWVDFTGSRIERSPGWFILKNAKEEDVYLVGKVSVYKAYEYYGKAWIAYAYPPAHIDREAWGCPYCTPDAEGYVRKFGAYSLHNGFLETGHCKPVEIKYCPECARPLNGAAADELEKRLRGL